ncbi:TonB-dependent receptor [Sphingomonas populi]|uniref:TonB-dependent receptor n=1 Tax=Sphingomonas populi TaxID=2484750 RepID=A0A4Q6XY38_9SPHN|nr:TonB-dependent receptor [Sphingomonas populi]RZF65085.1 TonB-dependent receptor [Sphingomonas populi]
MPYAVASSATPGTAAAPFRVTSGVIQNLGLDFGTGTPVSNQTSFYQLFDGNRQKFNLNVKDGIHPRFDIFTAKIDKDFGDGWNFGANLRSTSGSSSFSTLFQDPPVDTQYLISGNPRNSGDTGFNGLIRSAPYAAYYGNAVGVRAYYTDTVTGPNLTTAQAAPAKLANDVPVFAKVDATTLVADLRLGKTFDFGWSKHALTLGLYNSSFTYDAQSVFARGYSSIEKHSRKVDFYAVDAAGQQVGPSITKDSLVNPALFGLGVTSTELSRAIYILDHITLLDDRLNIDAGFRYQQLKINRVVTNSSNPGNTCEDLTPGNVVAGSTADSLAYKCVSIPDGSPLADSSKYHGEGFSLGANYRLFGGQGTGGETAIYGTVAKSFRLPGFEDYIFGGSATNASTGEVARGDLVEHIMQYEAGIRHTARTWNVSLSGFLINFKAKEQLGPTLVDLSSSVGGVSCAAVPTPNNCPFVRDRYRSKLNNKGLELELGYRPDFVPGLNLQGSVVLQNPKISSDAAFRDQIINGQYNVVNPQTYTPQRQPKIVANFRPVYTIPKTPITLFGQAYYYGKRFAGNDDTAIYPAYTQINAGALYTVNRNFDIQFNAENLNNAKSFTEGGSINASTVLSDGRYVSVARPLLGRTWKFTLSYRY